MKSKQLLKILGYHWDLSVSSLYGYHAEGRVNPGVTELTREQKKEDLKENVRKVPAFHHDFRYSGILRG